MSGIETKIMRLKLQPAQAKQYCSHHQHQLPQSEQDQLHQLPQSEQDQLQQLPQSKHELQQKLGQNEQKQNQRPELEQKQTRPEDSNMQREAHASNFLLKAKPPQLCDDQQSETMERDLQKQNTQQNGYHHKRKEQREHQQLPRLQKKDEYLEQQQLLHQTQQGSEMRRVASCNSANQLARSKEERRRVQFADELGLELTHVRVMLEPSCVPPVLPRHIMALLKQPQSGCDSASDSESDAAAKNRCQFECRFEQPGSRYILFRENLERNCVCLSGLHFEGRTARGVIGVKNICFDKRVFVRATFDSWRSYKDFNATYCPGSDGGAKDSFMFSFPCPTPPVDFEFCVGFEAANLGQTFWDNGSGQNYRVAAVAVSSKKKRSKTASRQPADPVEKFFTSSYRPSFDHVTEFSEYAAWEHHASRVYY